MKLISNFNLSDIIISKDYSATPPKKKKLERNKDLHSPIVINNDNILIDGYTTYINAIAQGVKSMDIYRGYIEIVTGVHKYCDKEYIWRVPGSLTGTINPGDRCKVFNGNGYAKITVTKVLQIQYAPQVSQFKSIVSKK